MGAVIALVAILVVLLSGLSAGLVNDGVSGLKRLPAAALLLRGSIGLGMAVGIGMGAMLASTPMPFALQAPDRALAAGLLVVLGMVGAAAAVVRITSVDPLTALGGQR